jgi:GTP cyclohydrolase I
VRGGQVTPYSEEGYVARNNLTSTNRNGQRGAAVRTNNRPAEGGNDSVAEDAIRTILRHVGEDPAREGLLRTPQRVVRAFDFLTRGYSQDPREVLNDALFVEHGYQEMIVCRDIDFYSLCEHHLLPFMGKAHVAYLPKNHIIGISKLPRIVEIYARRLQVQERMTTQIAETILEVLDPLGVAVVLEAEHLCMRMRGVEKQNSSVTTSAMLGVFRANQETRQELMTLLRRG